MKTFFKKHKLLVIALPLTLVLCAAAFFIVVQYNRMQEVKAYVSEGDRYLSDLNYEQAMICYQQAINIDEKNRGANLGLAECYEAGGQNVYAESIYRSLLENDPGDGEIYPKLAELLLRTDKPEEAKALIAEAVKHVKKDEAIEDWYHMTHPKAPAADSTPGSYDTRIQVALNADAGDIIYYTTDGSDPSAMSQVYAQPLILRNGTNTIRAIAVNSAGFASEIATFSYTINIADVEITVQDPIIESVIREYLDLWNGDPIYNDDIAQITSLYLIGSAYTAVEAPTVTYREDGYAFTLSYQNGYANEYYAQDWQGYLTTLADLQYMPFLHTLNIAYQPQLDISSLVLVPSLVHVSVLASDVTSAELAPFAQLSALEQLSLGWNGIDDLSPLSALKDLKTLSVWGNSITDLSPISAMTKLQVLDFSDNLVADISPVSSLTALRELWMYGNNVTKIAPVQTLNALNVLMVRGNPISDPEAVRAIYPHLTRIDTDLLGLADKE